MLVLNGTWSQLKLADHQKLAIAKILPLQKLLATVHVYCIYWMCVILCS